VGIPLRNRVYTMREYLSYTSLQQPHTLTSLPLLLSLSYAIPYKEAAMPWKELFTVAFVVFTTIAKELDKK